MALHFTHLIECPCLQFIAQITIHCAKDLLAKDLNGVSDPFVKVYLNETELAQTTTKHGNLNPMWEEFFNFPLLDKIPSTAILRFDILNELVYSQ